MTPADIVTALARHGTRIAVGGERVQLIFNGRAPPDDLVRAAREVKAALREIEIVRAMTSRAVGGDTEEERADVIEYDGGAPRAWAEALARLDSARPPAGVPPQQWVQFIDDCGRFLDDWWAARAAALGWRPLDLFGCDRERPLVRHDHAGLLWLLHGRRLLTLTADTRATAGRNRPPRAPIRLNGVTRHDTIQFR
jgi:hypothetical protein